MGSEQASTVERLATTRNMRPRWRLWARIVCSFAAYLLSHTVLAFLAGLGVVPMVVYTVLNLSIFLPITLYGESSLPFSRWYASWIFQAVAAGASLGGWHLP